MKLKASSFAAKVRLYFLLTVLLVVALGATAHSIRVSHHESQLVEIGHGLVEKYNETDARPVPVEGPEADVEIDANCHFEYVVFGEMTGIVRLVATPRPHAPIDTEYVIAYNYVYEDGDWHFTESYHEH